MVQLEGNRSRFGLWQVAENLADRLPGKPLLVQLAPEASRVGGFAATQNPLLGSFRLVEPQLRIIVLAQQRFRKLPDNPALLKLREQPLGAVVPAGDFGLQEASCKALVAQVAALLQRCEALANALGILKALTQFLAQFPRRVLSARQQLQRLAPYAELPLRRGKRRRLSRIQRHVSGKIQGAPGFPIKADARPRTEFQCHLSRGQHPDLLNDYACINRLHCHALPSS